MAKNISSMLQDFFGRFEQIPYSKKASVRVLDEVKKRTLVDAVKVWTDYVDENDGEPLELTDSKLGGYPYWVQGKEYPKAKDDGTPLVLLAQINFADVPHLPDYPERGILQFFVKPDSDYGCEFFKVNDERWRAVFHEEVGVPMSIEELKAMGVKSASELDAQKEEYFPLHAEFLLTFDKHQFFMSSACSERFESVVRDVAKDLKLPIPDEALSACNIFDEDALQDYDEQCEQGHKIGGYPCFTQEDPRNENDGYDVLLFQLDSGWQGEDAPNAQIMWGDAGVANFFIKREDLKKRDFSNVLYNWDCM